VAIFNCVVHLSLVSKRNATTVVIGGATGALKPSSRDGLGLSTWIIGSVHGHEPVHHGRRAKE